MSLADFTIIIFSAFSTVTCVPGRKPIFDGDCEAATGDTVSSAVEREPAFLDRLQRDIGRHDLGDGGRIPGIGGVVGLQHLAGIGFDHQQRFGMRGARRDERRARRRAGSCSTMRLRSSGRRKCTIRFRSFETRLSKQGGPGDLTFGFQAWSETDCAVAHGGCKPIPACRSGTEAGRLNRGRNRPQFRR